MTKFIKTTIVVSLTFIYSSVTFTDDHEAPMIVPMEHFACDYNPGKDRDDDLKVVKEWNKFIDESGVNYSSYFLDPYYTNTDEQYDTHWIGFSTSFEEMGKAQELMLSEEGAKIQAKFDKVTSCGEHDIWGSYTVRASSNDGGGVLNLSSCKLTEGTTTEDLMSADKKMNAFADQAGNTGGIYRWFPGPGVQLAWTSKYDFLAANTTSSLSQWGAGADGMVNGGGAAMQASIYGSLMQCEDTRVFLATQARSSNN